MQIYPMPIVNNSDVEKMLDEMLEGINLVTTKYRLEQDGYEIWCKYGTEVEDYNPRLLGSWRFIEDDNCEQIYFDIEVNGIWYAGHYYFVCYDEVIAMLLEAAGEIK